MTLGAREGMAKKCAGKQPEVTSERVGIITLKGSPEYRAWADGISESTLPTGGDLSRCHRQVGRGTWMPAPPPTAKRGRPRGRLEESEFAMSQLPSWEEQVKAAKRKGTARHRPRRRAVPQIRVHRHQC